MFGHKVVNESGIRFLDCYVNERMARMYGEDIVEVLVFESETGIYHGWIDTGKTVPEMIHHKKIFEICFAYGSAAEVERGRGRVVKLDIKEYEGEK